VSSTTFALSAFKISIRRRCASFAWSKAVWVHRQAHAAACLTPIEPSFFEESVEPFAFRLPFDLTTSWYNHRMNLVRYSIAFDDVCGRPEVFNSRVGARTDKHAFNGNFRQACPSLQPHVFQSTRGRLRSVSSEKSPGEGIGVLTEMTWPGFVPQVICGSMSLPW